MVQYGVVCKREESEKMELKEMQERERVQISYSAMTRGHGTEVKVEVDI